MFRAMSSIRPRVFMSAPSCSESLQLIPVKRAASALPPSLPSVATAMISRHKSHPRSVVEQADLRAQPGEGEEQRQQEHRAEVLHAHVELVPEAVTVRHDHAGQEGAEERVEADRARRASAAATTTQTTAASVLSEGASLASRASPEPRAQRLAARPRASRRRTPARSSRFEARACEARRARDRDHEREDAPRRHVAHGRAGERRAAERRSASCAAPAGCAPAPETP